MSPRTQNKTAHIIGAGGHARSLRSVLEKNGYDDIRMYEDDSLIPDGVALFNGVGNKAVVGNSGLSIRRSVWEKFRDSICRVESRYAVNLTRYDVGYGSQVMCHAVINSGAVIGANVIINTGAIIEHDVVVKDHSHIAPGAILCGGVVVGVETHIGAGAVVRQGVNIGDGCVVGAGAVVVRDVADGETVMGNPAKVVT